MCRCQNLALQDPTTETFAAAAEAYDRWNKLASIEEKFFRQKSCVRWLGVGDRNTVFFHQAVQTRTSRNIIKSTGGEMKWKRFGWKRRRFPARIYKHRALSYRSDAPGVGATAPRNTQNGGAAARNTRSGEPA
ncbi:hypothetical protein DY000_02061598 [Brassica cretica]|uniref:Uncharacterized protein n=1 Tax=Brassica cretica TaxID=69181 RepID=A0ABQ7AVE0_BRACR|nr:hypothetical protein DY000_02061598 [Brassica cretica]